MTIRNWQESDEPLSYSWPIAAGIGILTFMGMMGVGNHTDIMAAQVAFPVFVAFGVFFEWAFFGRDPGRQLEDALMPKGLATYDDYFGAEGGKPGAFARQVDSVFAPGPLKSFDEMFGTKPEQLTGIRAFLDNFTPKSLSSYDEMMGKRSK